jgi:hypothetical protein
VTGLPTVEAKKLQADIDQNNQILNQNLKKMNITSSENQQTQMHTAVADWTAVMTGLINNTDMSKVPYASLRTTAYTAAVTSGLLKYLPGTPAQQKKALNGLVKGWLQSRAQPAAKGKEKDKIPRTIQDFTRVADDRAKELFDLYQGEQDSLGNYHPNPAYAKFNALQMLVGEYEDRLKKKGMKPMDIIKWATQRLLAAGYTGALMPGAAGGGGGAPPAPTGGAGAPY